MSDFDIAKKIAEHHLVNLAIGIGNSFSSELGIEMTELKEPNLISSIQDALRNVREEEKNSARNRVRQKFSSLSKHDHDFKNVKEFYSKSKLNFNPRVTFCFLSRHSRVLFFLPILEQSHKQQFSHNFVDCYKLSNMKTL